MKKNILKILTIFILILFQLSLLNKLTIFSFVPNLIFVLSIVLLLRGFLSDSLLVGSLGGLFLDLTSPLRFGFYSVVLITILLGINLLVLKNTPTVNVISIFLIVLGAFIIADLAIFLITKTLPSWQILLDGFLNGLLGVAVFLILEKLVRKEEINVSL